MVMCVDDIRCTLVARHTHTATKPDHLLKTAVITNGRDQTKYNQGIAQAAGRMVVKNMWTVDCLYPVAMLTILYSLLI